MVSYNVTALDPSPPMTILDSGATGHYFSTQTNLPHQKPTSDLIRVTVANDQTIYSTHTAELPIPGIPLEARMVHLFPAMSRNLIAKQTEALIVIN
jgi:hypothetical protein